ncbi:3-demethylubiquinone-9 3-methyltransferase [Rhodococcus sp. RD6.2]|uniref:VOC family protein n=1 Tax=Rhodococcus sp. RD6.2 TaxID=260936 RepID=UPI00063BCCAC|nr:VOC family protein [Rhodococcus sp. RD6.2]CRK52354.1 3-demethylubiquinone-9 3-methyltransferase [Rhodococcus sp. RD6.2]
MQKFTPCLWFDTQAEEAAQFYTSVFKDSSIGEISRYGEGMPKPAGTAMTVEFTLNGQTFTALNGGPEFAFTEAISFQVDCTDQAEVDEYWAALTADGGEESQCGWLKDKFGLSWQIVPRELQSVLGGPDPAGAQRAVQAMLQMRKLDINALKEAYAG